MNWPATERYYPTAVPGGLGLVQDLLNTASGGRPRQPDLLAEVASAQEWAATALRSWAEGTGRGRVRLTLTEEDLPELRRLREQLRRALTARQGAADADAVRFTSCTLRVSLHGDAALTAEPEGEGWRWLTSAVLGEALLAQATGVWQRLKICRNEKCGGAFYDRSRNNSGVWHSTRGCGNAANLRASRQRRRERERDCGQDRVSEDTDAPSSS
ncbi:CGNR zinc finger domain-containing protein [Streptomyces sp. NPDC042319]|uniref:CGNR zinc finger domain-containing protein n=1 Tax=Streptomyces sp. NPDC042319 TaxID=3154332 RepID=UPI0033F2E4D3